MKKNKIFYLEILRIVACFLVIINHTLGLVHTTSFIGILLKYIIFMLSKIAVPIFFMISGYLLLSKDLTYKEVFLKKIPKILIPLLFCSGIYYLKYTDDPRIIDFLLSILSKPQITAYWYLYTLILLYLLTPFIRKMCKNFEEKDYIVFGLIILLLQGIIPLLRIFFDINVTTYFTKHIISSYIGYYVIGYYLGNKKFKNKEILLISLIALITYILSIVYLMIQYQKTGIYSLPLDNASFLTTIIPALAVFILGKHLFDINLKNKIIKNVVIYTGSATFGIYLFHMLFINEIYRTNIIQSLFSVNGFLGLLCLDIISFIVLTLFILILKRIPIIKNYL